jgi:O-acetyl-ADP-ribose deacetylase (regulator of RNase III)
MKHLKKDLTTVECGLIIHGVNCRGSFGSGIAGAIRRKWPSVYQSYMNAYHNSRENNTQLLGDVDFALVHDEPLLYVANLFSQEYYGNDGKTYANPMAIKLGLTKCFMFADKNDLTIYSGKVGCGLGGLRWANDVEPIFEQLETQFSKSVYICDI